ncbi:MAG: hypothetical protein LBM96_01285 [Methanobrevibacter sp.]|jgi:hypothetical protein|nr:hypothetical protein [Candidatus Methanoflexus mossambicus]
MNLTDVETFDQKIVEFQTDLSLYAVYDAFDIQPYKPKNKYSKKVFSEDNLNQTVLFENITYYSDNNFNKSFKNKDNDIKIFNQTVFDLNSDNSVNFNKNNLLVDYMKLSEIKDHIYKITLNEDTNFAGKEDELVFGSDGILAMLHPRCDKCNSIVKQKYGKKTGHTKNSKDEDIEIFLQKYLCECGHIYSTPLPQRINEEIKETIELDDKIKKIHASTGLSFDKTAEVLKTTMGIRVSHTYIGKILQKEQKDVVYDKDLVVLPQDFKRDKLTSEERHVSDVGQIWMSKMKNIKLSGDISLLGNVSMDEDFFKVSKKRRYLVSIFDSAVQDIPVAIAVMNTRKLPMMLRFIDFYKENFPVKTITSDMLGVYQALTKKLKIPINLCEFHGMKYINEKIFNEIKINKDKWSKTDIIYFLMLNTEFNEIFRSLNEYNAKIKYNQLVDHLKNVPKHLKKSMKIVKKEADKLFKRFYMFSCHMDHEEVPSTSNSNETWHSLSYIRNLKNRAKDEFSLLKTIVTDSLNYRPNYRTLQSRRKYPNIKNQPN